MSGGGTWPWAALRRLVWREARGARGRLVFVIACLALGVAAVTGVGATIDAIQGTVRRDARALLAADVAVSARRELPPELASFLLSRADAEVARATKLSAMALAGDQSATDPVCIKSPLHGELQARAAAFASNDSAELTHRGQPEA